MVIPLYSIDMAEKVTQIACENCGKITPIESVVDVEDTAGIMFALCSDCAEKWIESGDATKL